MPRKQTPPFVSEKEIFPSRLRQLMEENHTTQTILGDAIDVTRQAIGNYTSGQSSPDWQRLAKIARFFNVSVDWLIGVTDIRSVDTNLQSVCSYTGLSETTVTNLMRIDEMQEKYSVYDYKDYHILDNVKNLRKTMKDFFSDESFYKLFASLSMVRNHVEVLRRILSDFDEKSWLAGTLEEDDNCNYHLLLYLKYKDYKYSLFALSESVRHVVEMLYNVSDLESQCDYTLSYIDRYFKGELKE